MRPWNDPWVRGGQPEQCDIIPSIIQEKLIEHSSPARHDGNAAKDNRSKNPSCQRTNFFMEHERQCINGPTGSRPDAEDAIARKKSLVRGLGRVWWGWKVCYFVQCGQGGPSGKGNFGTMT